MKYLAESTFHTKAKKTYCVSKSYATNFYAMVLINCNKCSFLLATKKKLRLQKKLVSIHDGYIF
jgi:hypothetical protein